MTDLDFESAQLELLTDALRAGPGTPQWRDALATLDVTPGADEFRLLCAARERLASGRNYREVRAGPMFTRRVFDAIEDDQAAAAPKALPSANWIAALSAAVILAILGVVAYLVVPRAQTTPAGDGLAQTYFVDTRAASRFENDLGVAWSAFGPLAVQAKAGLRPVLVGLDPQTFRGGGAVYDGDLPADQPFSVEASVRLAKPNNDIVVQVFVAADRTFAAQSATSAHELVWQVRGADTSVYLPDGTVAATGPKARAGQQLDARVSIKGAQAAVELNGRRVWTGANQLDSTAPRAVGVRFLAGAAAKPSDAPVVESIRVLVPQKQ